jgi:hypothetical protein
MELGSAFAPDWFARLLQLGDFCGPGRPAYCPQRRRQEADRARFGVAFDQIGTTFGFKDAKSKSGDIFKDSYLPATVEREFN